MRKLKILKLTIFITAVLGMGFFVFSGEAQAATYYVSTTGSDTKNCTDATTNACATFNYAQTKMSTGDTLIAKAGTYNQTITVSKPNITIRGELDANGNRLSIISPYTDVSGGWTLTTDGVYTKRLGWTPEALAVEISGTMYKIERLCQHDGKGNCLSWETNIHRGSGQTYPVYAGATSPQCYVNMWNGFNALYASCSNSGDNSCYNPSWDGITYLKILNSADAIQDVNSMTIYAAISGADTIEVTADNVTIKNFEIRAKRKGIEIQSDNVTVVNNFIVLGGTKVALETTSSNSTVSDNEITSRQYHTYIGEYTHGPFEGSISLNNNDVCVARHIYEIQKMRIADDGGGDYGSEEAVELFGDNLTVTGNTIYDIRHGINHWSGSTGNTISNNYIYNIPGVGIGLGYNVGNVTVSNNQFSNVNYAIRFQNWDGSTGHANNTVAYVYNNRVINPYGLGSAFYFHFTSGGSGTISNPGDVWFYHNTVSSGHSAIAVPFDAGNFTPDKGIGQMYVVNNIFSSSYVFLSNYAPGGCWYNWIGGTQAYQISYGRWSTLWQCENTGFQPSVGNKSNMWSIQAYSQPFTSNAPIWSIIDSSAVNAGIDISQPFTINGTTYPALPGFTSGYAGTDGKPDMGAVQTNPADVDGNGSVNIKDIQEVIRCIIDSQSCNFLDRSDANNDIRVNIKDIQEIIREIIAPN